MSELARNDVVVLRSGALGDCVASFPTIRLLRERLPESHITIIGDPYSAPIFDLCKGYDDLVVLSHRSSKPRYAAELLALRRRRFDVLIDLQGSGRSRLQALAIGARRSIGFDKGHVLSRLPYSDRVPYPRGVHAAERIANSLAPLKITFEQSDLHFADQLEPRYTDVADKLLEAAGVRRPYAMLQVTCAWHIDYRIWPAERYAAVAKYLTELGFSVVIASKANDEAVKEVVAASEVPIFNLAGGTDLPTLAAVHKGSSLYVGYNTGPVHIAAWMARPIVALYEPGSRVVEWRPFSAAPWKIVQAKPAPIPSGFRFDLIETEEVIESIREVLESACADPRFADLAAHLGKAPQKIPAGVGDPLG